MHLTLLGAGEIEQALDMETAIEVNAQAFIALSQGRAIAPERLRLETPRGVGLVMPAALEGASCLCVKVITIFPGNPGQGLPTSQALLLLLDAGNGLPLALLEGGRLTALRTGAGAGVATRLLALPQARVLALLGAGGMACDQARAV
ncbi:MAG: ornithine cyclodeaminase family protein, partial [Desulfarculus sp.]|nr:ornithine cyclodeaminase family protein [Desulfarculus sp.]